MEAQQGSGLTLAKELKRNPLHPFHHSPAPIFGKFSGGADPPSLEISKQSLDTLSRDFCTGSKPLGFLPAQPFCNSVIHFLVQ